MGSIKSYQDLQVWQRAMDLVTLSYRLTKLFPSDEQFGLTNQLRRAAVSIPSNIAEGSGRGIIGAYINHLSIAQGSLQEVETQMLIAHRLGYLAEQQIEEATTLCAEVGRLLLGLKRSLKRYSDEG